MKKTRYVLMALIVIGLAVQRGWSQTYEATVDLIVSGSVLNVDLYIETTTGTSAILGDATFTVDYNPAALSYLSKDGTCDGRWDAQTDASYNNITSSNVPPRASLDVTKSGEGVGLDIPNGPRSIANRIGRIRFNIIDIHGLPNVTWNSAFIDIRNFAGASINGSITFTNPEGVPLPITLASFTAQVLPGGFRVKLDWTTLTEINNYGFNVQRRRDTDSLFVDVPNSFIPGHGTTTEPHHYSYTDTTATRALWSYRLKQIDLDGTVHYSAAITVDLTTAVEEPQLPTVFSLHQNYPNPFNPSTTIRYDLPVATHVTLKLYDIVGREAQVLVDGIQEPGYKSVQFDARSLASGVYLYRLQAGTFVEIRKMVVIK